MSFLADWSALEGTKFGSPMKRFWDVVREGCNAFTTRVFNAMRAAGTENIDVNFPSTEERTNAAGEWDWDWSEQQVPSTVIVLHED